MADGGHVCRRIEKKNVNSATRPLGEHFRRVSSKSDQWSRRSCDNGLKTADLGTKSEKWPTAAMLVGGPERKMPMAHLDPQGNVPCEFRLNPTGGLGGVVSTRKMFTDVRT